MIMTNYIYKILILAPLFASSLLFSSCDDNKRQKDTKAIAENRNDEKFDKDKKEKDAQFLVNAAEIHLKHIHLGQLAQSKGKSEHVKELSKKLERDHTESLTDLAEIAKSKNISIPSLPKDNSTDAYKNLSYKSGNDFDKAYSDMMVKGHKDAIETFEDASNDCTDEDIRKWAVISLPYLRKHLDHSIHSQKEFDDMYLANQNQYKIK